MPQLILPFNTAAHNPRDRFDYDAAVAEAYDMFPHLRQKLYFYDLGEGRWVHPDPTAHQTLDDKFKKHPAALTYISDCIDKFTADKNSCALGGGNGDRFILLYTSPDKLRMLGRHSSLAEDIQFVFDHELGHVVSPNGARNIASMTRHECVADIYSALRHYQRYGLESDAVERLMLVRAQRIVSLAGKRHREHFTGDALEKLLEEKDKIQIMGLSGAETAELAGKLGTAFTPPDLHVADLSISFDQFQTGLARDRGEKPLRDLAQQLLLTGEATTFKWGARALLSYMDGNIEPMKTEGKIIVNDPPPILQGEYWQEVRTKLRERLEADKIVSGIALAPAKPAKTSQLILRA